jgi:hypothetical protein
MTILFLPQHLQVSILRQALSCSDSSDRPQFHLVCKEWHLLYTRSSNYGGLREIFVPAMMASLRPPAPNQPCVPPKRVSASSPTPVVSARCQGRLNEELQKCMFVAAHFDHSEVCAAVLSLMPSGTYRGHLHTGHLRGCAGRTC